MKPTPLSNPFQTPSPIDSHRHPRTCSSSPDLPASDRSGQGLSEYMILAMLIVVISIAATKSLGNTIKSKLENVNEQLQQIHVP